MAKPLLSATLQPLPSHRKEKVSISIMPQRFAGFDLHKKEVEACIIDHSGTILRRARFAATGEAITRFALDNKLAEDCAVALEATTNTWPVAALLQPLCASVTVSNPLRTKAIAQAKTKTDKVDSLVLAQLLRADFLPTAQAMAAAYFGLVPSTRQSGDKCYHGRITKQGRSHARWLLVQAAQQLEEHPGPLGHFFRKLANKKNRNVAVVACARKLATIAWHMLTNQEPYRYALSRTIDEKLRRLRVLATGERRKTGPRKGQPRSANHGTGVKTRALPGLDPIYAEAGLLGQLPQLVVRPLLRPARPHQLRHLPSRIVRRARHQRSRKTAPRPSLPHRRQSAHRIKALREPRPGIQTRIPRCHVRELLHHQPPFTTPPADSAPPPSLGCQTYR